MNLVFAFSSISTLAILFFLSLFVMVFFIFIRYGNMVREKKRKEKEAQERIDAFEKSLNLSTIDSLKKIEKVCKKMQSFQKKYNKYGDSVFENKTFKSIKDWLQFLNEAKV